MPNESERYVKSYPALMRTAIWKDDGLFKLYHYCLYRASRNIYKWRGKILMPGDLLFSYRSAAEQLDWSIWKLRNKVKALAATGIIGITTSSEGTLIRVLDFCEADLLMENTPNSPRSESIPHGVSETDTQCAENQYASVPETDTRCIGNRYAVVSESSTGCAGNRYASVSETSTNQEGNQERDTRDNIALRIEPSDFNQLWLAYPVERRTRRDEAESLYKTALQEGATIDAFLAALDAEKNSQTWLADQGRYIPGIVKWLQKESWRDYLALATNEEDEVWVSR